MIFSSCLILSINFTIIHINILFQRKKWSDYNKKNYSLNKGLAHFNSSFI